MYPGINPRQMQQAMKKLGIKQEEINATEVIIKCVDRELVIENPSVLRVNMAGQESLQITGDISERTLQVEISEEDISTVMETAGVSHEEAILAIKNADFDLAKAILDLQEKKE